MKKNNDEYSLEDYKENTDTLERLKKLSKEIEEEKEDSHLKRLKKIENRKKKLLQEKKSKIICEICGEKGLKYFFELKKEPDNVSKHGPYNEGQKVSCENFPRFHSEIRTLCKECLKKEKNSEYHIKKIKENQKRLYPTKTIEERKEKFLEVLTDFCKKDKSDVIIQVLKINKNLYSTYDYDNQVCLCCKKENPNILMDLFCIDEGENGRKMLFCNNCYKKMKKEIEKILKTKEINSELI